MEAKGIRTDKREFNRWVKATNVLIQSIRKKITALLTAPCSASFLQRIRAYSTFTNPRENFWNVKKKYLTSENPYAIMPKVKENALTGGGTHGRIGDGAAV